MVTSSNAACQHPGYSLEKKKRTVAMLFFFFRSLYKDSRFREE
jgi:hypothetical protein